MISLQSVRELLAHNIETVLVDASGVLYTDAGVVPGAREALQLLRSENRDVFLVTNNTSLSIQGIHQYLDKQRLEIDADKIISSGLGLSWDDEIRKNLEGKAVYVYGWEGSKSYVSLAGGDCVDEISDAEAIAVLASYDTGNEEEIERILGHLEKYPETYVVCGNPDRYIMGLDGLFPVCGYYAEELEKRLGRDIVWIGKPCDNFSRALKKELIETHQLSLDKSVCFCDDNLENVKSISEICGVSGACILDTGLSKNGGFTESQKCLNYEPEFILKGFSV